MAWCNKVKGLIIVHTYTSLVPRPAPKRRGKGLGTGERFLVVHHQQFCFQVNQSDHSFGMVI